MVPYMGCLIVQRRRKKASGNQESHPGRNKSWKTRFFVIARRERDERWMEGKEREIDNKDLKAIA